MTITKAEKIEIFNNVPIEKTIYEEFIEGTMINIFKLFESF